MSDIIPIPIPIPMPMDSIELGPVSSILLLVTLITFVISILFFFITVIYDFIKHDIGKADRWFDRAIVTLFIAIIEFLALSITETLGI